MTTFRIGQPVRLARHLCGPEYMKTLVGREGVVTSSLYERKFSDGEVLVCHTVSLKYHPKVVYCIPEELEPIVPRGDPLVAAQELMPELEEAFQKVFEHV